MDTASNICHDERFHQQVAIVTGSASGIGKAVALRLGREGARVVLCDIDSRALDLTQNEFLAASIPCEAKLVDVSDSESVVSCVEQVAEACGRIDIFVHCAGITGPTGRKIVDISVEEYDHVYRVNQRSSFLVAKAVLPHMLHRDYGRILMFASIAGKEGNPAMSPYSSTKAAVIGLVKGLGKEYAQSGITINAVAPAVIRTPLNDKTDPGNLQYMLEKIPMKRLGTVEEAASLAAWICSSEASFTTGFTFDLSGGRATY
jgi:2-dehydro-3-deoxy-L-rhamnonate dehydrogenase (NAD+)